MYLFLFVCIILITGKICVDWTQWRAYYPTIQFYIICNLLYNFLFFQHTLWAYNSITLDWLNHTIIELIFTFIIVPILMMIYLQYFPTTKKKYLYVGVWITSFSVIEYFCSIKGLFLYDNGWSIWWSILFNTIMFSVIRVHFKNNILGFLVSIPIIIILMLFFHPELNQLK